MSDQARDALAEVIRLVATVGPIGPNSWEILTRGGKVALTPREAEEIADAILASDALAAHVRAARAGAVRSAAGELDDLALVLMSNRGEQVGYALTAGVVRKCREIVNEAARRIERGE